MADIGPLFLNNGPRSEGEISLAKFAFEMTLPQPEGPTARLRRGFSGARARAALIAIRELLGKLESEKATDFWLSTKVTCMLGRHWTDNPVHENTRHDRLRTLGHGCNQIRG